VGGSQGKRPRERLGAMGIGHPTPRGIRGCWEGVRDEPDGGVKSPTPPPPPAHPFSDPRAVLLSHVEAAVPCQEVGHVSIGAESAKREFCMLG
jgi:hypothetical protein